MIFDFILLNTDLVGIMFTNKKGNAHKQQVTTIRLQLATNNKYQTLKATIIISNFLSHQLPSHYQKIFIIVRFHPQNF